MTPEQKKEILESESHNKYCGKYHCVSCPLDEFKGCKDGYHEIKLEAEKAKVEKLKKCVEHYASLEHNREAQSLEYDEPSFFFDGDDISTEIWHGKDHNGVERSHKGRYYGKLARLTLKEIGE